MKIRAAVLLVAIGFLLPARIARRASLVLGGIRRNKPVKLTGAVTKFEWTNPHAWIYIDAKDEYGQGRQLGVRAGRGEWPHAVRLDTIYAESRRRSHHRRHSSQERIEQRECSDGDSREHG